MLLLRFSVIIGRKNDYLSYFCSSQYDDGHLFFRLNAKTKTETAKTAAIVIIIRKSPVEKMVLDMPLMIALSAVFGRISTIMLSVDVITPDASPSATVA